MFIRQTTLTDKVKTDNLIRLARYLRLLTAGRSHKEIAEEVFLHINWVIKQPG